MQYIFGLGPVDGEALLSLGGDMPELPEGFQYDQFMPAEGVGMFGDVTANDGRFDPFGTFFTGSNTDDLGTFLTSFYGSELYQMILNTYGPDAANMWLISQLTAPPEEEADAS